MIYQSLTVLYVDTYNQYKKKGVVHIPNITVATISMGSVYESLISEGLLVPIEKLDRGQKESLTKECRETNEEFTNESLIQRCKQLHLIRLINDNT